MQNKIKFIVMGLVGLLVINIFITLQAFNAKQLVERERDSLRRENDSLVAKINESMQDGQRLKERLNILNQSLESAMRERDEFQQNYLLRTKERDGLVKQLESRVAAIMPALPAPAPVADDAYWGRILKEKTDLEIQLANIRKDLREMQINNEALQKDKSTLELEVRSQIREKQDLKRQIEYNQKLMETLSQDLVREKNDKFQIEDSLKTIKAENLTLRRQLKSLGNRKLVLEKKFAELQAKSSGLEKSFNEMSGLLRDKMAQIDSLKRQFEPARVSTLPAVSQPESVELPQIVVRPQTGPMTEEITSVVTGKILAVKRDNNFVIIDLGEEAGVVAGNTFGVYRGNELISEIKVIQVRRNISACDIKNETSPLRIGDTVR